MHGEGPPFLPVGTEVSAKYRGAFCEAKVKHILKNVKCRITLKDTGVRLVVQDDELRGNIKVGHLVDVKQAENGQYVPCIVNKITDQSTYTVVFDDGDENTLRRTQLCLKGEKHFVKSDTLDELPLTHPEHFGTPVMRGSRIQNSKRMMHHASSSDSESDADSSDDENAAGRKKGHPGNKKIGNMIGQVVCLEIEDRKKTLWVPAVVVQPTADSTDLKQPNEILVKSFKDTKFFAVSRRAVKTFNRELAMKNDDKTLKLAFEKALQYYDTHELPISWDRDELLGSESEDEDETSDEEPSEEKDRFVAQLYKFMDDRGTPMNKAPQVSSRDLNLYKLFQLVQDTGGYNKVTNQVRWHVIYSKMSLPPGTATGSNQLKIAYKKYLHAFEDFDRKLGCTMGTITRPRARHSSGRSLLSFRERDRESTPKSPRRHRKIREDDNDEVRSVHDVGDKSDVEMIKTDACVKLDLDLVPESSDSETDSMESRPMTRESTRPATKDELPKSKETPSRPVREEVRRNREEALALKIAKEEIMKIKDEKPVPEVVDEKVEEEQPKKRPVRKKECEESPPQKEVQGEDKRCNRRPKDDTTSEPSESKTNSDEDDDEKDKVDKSSKMDYCAGTRLKIKYGKGKSIKIYEAKVLETKFEGGCRQYKVHYAGWNIRYDEWIKKDRIFGPVDDSPSSNTPKMKPKTPPGIMKPKLLLHSASKKLILRPPFPQTPVSSRDKDKDVTDSVATKLSLTPATVLTKLAATPSAKTPTVCTGKTPVASSAKAPVMQMKTPASIAKTPASIAKTSTVSSTKTLAVSSEKTLVVSSAKTPVVSSAKAPVVSSAKTPVVSSAKTSVVSSTKTSVVSSAKTPVVSSAKTPVVSSAKTTVVSNAKTPVVSSAKIPVVSSAKIPVVSSAKTSVVSSAKTPTVSSARASVVSSSKTPAGSNGSKIPRPTRSTSVESTLAAGLPAKRRSRRNSGLGDVESSSHVSDSSSDESSDESSSSEEEEITERITRSRRDVDIRNTESVIDIKKPDAPEPTAVVVKAAEKEAPPVVKDVKMEEEVEPIAQETKTTVQASVTRGTASKQRDAKLERSIDDIVAEVAKVPEPVKEEPKVVKKVDDKIYDFEDSSSQDSFRNGLLGRSSAAEAKEVVERGRFKRKEPMKRVRAPSTDSATSVDSLAKSAQTKSDKELSESANIGKDTLRSGKRTSEVKPDVEKKLEVEKEKKKPGPKPKELFKDSVEKAKPKTIQKTDKPRGKRKVDIPEVTKPEEVDKKKVRRKKDTKEQEKDIAEPVKDSPKKEPDVRLAIDISSNESPEKSESTTLPDPSWSPTYIPAPTLTQTVSIETKPEREVMDEPAPQLSPIASMSVAPLQHREEIARMMLLHSRLQELPTAELPKESQMTVFENTPPETPEGSPGPPLLGADSPVHIEDSVEDHSESEPMEDSPDTPGGESPNTCNTSIVSNSSGGSSGNAPGSESEDISTSLKRSKEDEEDDEDDNQNVTVEKPSPKKRRKRVAKITDSGRKSLNKQSVSDSDESEQMKSPELSRSLTMMHSSSPPHRMITRVPKYNFLDLQDGKYLEGEDRIKFLMSKITDIRKLYMQLKSEVACIDRRRKRHRRKINDAAAAAAAAAAVAAVVDRGEAEMC